MFFGICFTKGTACYPLLTNKGIYQRHLHQCSFGLHLGDGAGLCKRMVADGTHNSLCYWLHGVLKHACQLPLHWHASQCPGNAHWLQAFSGAEDSFVPALGHFVLLLCQSPTGTLLTPSCNCLHVAKAKTPKIREPKSCFVGLCFPPPIPFFMVCFLISSTDSKR